MLHETFSVSFKLLPFSFKIVACGPSSESERRPRPDIIEDDDIPVDEYEDYLDSPGSIQPQIRGNAVFPSITEVSLK